MGKRKRNLPSDDDGNAAALVAPPLQFNQSNGTNRGASITVHYLPLMLIIAFMFMLMVMRMMRPVSWRRVEQSADYSIYYYLKRIGR